jgi:Polysaccharide lyase
MKSVILALACFLMLIAVPLFSVRVLPQHIHDGFESLRLNLFCWSTQRLVAGVVQSETAVVHSGARALAITVRDGDRYEASSEGGAATERDELMESWWLYARAGHSYVYSFSLNLPNDLSQTSERLVIAQWRQLCEATNCEPDRPVIAIRYEDGRVPMTKQDQERKVVLYQGNEDVRGKWLSFRFMLLFSSSANGRIEATLNRKRIVNYQGPTLFQTSAAYPVQGLIYFKTGLCRVALQRPPWTM